MTKPATQTSEMIKIVDLARAVREDFRKRALHLQLSQSQWRILLCLYRAPGSSPSALAATLEVSPVTITQSVDRLVKADWVERRPLDTDRRAVRLFLTEKAGAIVDELNAIGETLNRELFKGFSKEEQATLGTFLLRLKENLEGRDS